MFGFWILSIPKKRSRLTFHLYGCETFCSAQVVVDGALDLLVMVGPGDIVDLEEAPSLIILSLVVNVPLVTVDRWRGVRLRQAPVRSLKFLLAYLFNLSTTTLPSMINARLTQQRFWPGHEKTLTKTISRTPHNPYVSFKLAPFILDFGFHLLRLKAILVYHNPQLRKADLKLTFRLWGC